MQRILWLAALTLVGAWLVIAGSYTPASAQGPTCVTGRPLRTCEFWSYDPALISCEERREFCGVGGKYFSYPDYPNNGLAVTVDIWVTVREYYEELPRTYGVYSETVLLGYTAAPEGTYDCNTLPSYTPCAPPNPDGDGYTVSDCNDNDPTIYPGAEELCDDKDNNCNFEIDEGDACKLCMSPADFDLTAILNNSVKVAPKGAEMHAEFTPNCGLSLEEAAQLVGVHHFNWHQRVVKAPWMDLLQSSIALASRCSGLRTQDGSFPTPPFPDPPYGGYRYQIDDCNEHGFPVVDFPIRDSKPGYWDEEFGDEINTCRRMPYTERSGFETNLHQNPGGADTLVFYDKPGLDFTSEALIDLLQGTAFIEFENYLVGVDKNGNPQRYFAKTVPGTSFRWRWTSALLGDGDSAVLGNSHPELGTEGTAEYLGPINSSNITPEQEQWLANLGFADSGDTGTGPSANHPPVADAGPDQTIAAGAGCLAPVALDSMGSSDPDGDALMFTWMGPFGTASGPQPTVSLPLGTHTLTLTVDDGRGGTASDTVMVKVIDTTPSSIASVTATPHTLWPPNHKMVPVAVAVSVSDNCDPTPVCEIASVSSNEPVSGTEASDTSPDWQITGHLTMNLRAERTGAGNGRAYTATVQCTDAAKNSATKPVTVTVPHDQGKK